MIRTQNRASIDTLISPSIFDDCFTGILLREVLGLAAVSNRTAMIPMNRMGNQPIPPQEGPKGTSHTPPAHANKATTMKNQSKLFQGPLVLKAKDTIQTMANPKATATNRSKMNMNFSFSWSLFSICF
jgi:hypothetical protein